MISFEALSQFLPEGVIDFNGTEVVLNLSQLTGNDLNPDSSCVEPFVKLLDELANFTAFINDLRLK